jgi:Na+/melibiose symporter-like transporter
VANAGQTPETLGGILILFSLLPASFSLLSAVAIAFYKLDEPVVRQMERELGSRRSASA